MRKINLNYWALAILLNLMALPGHAQQKPYKTVVGTPFEWQYLLYLPPAYKTDTTKEFPLMLFLHGGGESGTDLELVKKHGPPKLIAEGKDFPFIVLSPQNPYMTKFWPEAAVMGLLTKIEKEYRVDSNRIYLAGLSRGGYGAWRLAIQWPNKFAALVAISGESPADYAPWLKKLPIWVFHGADDPSISVSESDNMVARLRKNGNPVKYTRYKNTGHDAWTKTFNNPALYKWLLKQKKE